VRALSGALRASNFSHNQSQIRKAIVVVEETGVRVASPLEDLCGHTPDMETRLSSHGEAHPKATLAGELSTQMPPTPFSRFFPATPFSPTTPFSPPLFPRRGLADNQQT
jgi:hypothetical protein